MRRLLDKIEKRKQKKTTSLQKENPAIEGVVSHHGLDRKDTGSQTVAQELIGTIPGSSELIVKNDSQDDDHPVSYDGKLSQEADTGHAVEVPEPEQPLHLTVRLMATVPVNNTDAAKSETQNKNHGGHEEPSSVRGNNICSNDTPVVIESQVEPVEIDNEISSSLPPSQKNHETDPKDSTEKEVSTTKLVNPKSIQYRPESDPPPKIDTEEVAKTHSSGAIPQTGNSIKQNSGIGSTSEGESVNTEIQPQTVNVNPPQPSQVTVSPAPVAVVPPLSHLERGIHFAKLAIEADNGHDYTKALGLYYQASEAFVQALKLERNPRSRLLITTKAGEYLDRVDKIRKFLGRPDLGGASGGNSQIWSKSTQSEKSWINDVREQPNVKMKEVIGLENAKKVLQETVVFPVKFPKLFSGARRPVKSILLYGAPGSGKTYLAKAVATEAACSFFGVSVSDLASRYVGESAQLVQELFATADAEKPAIIFIDEIDALCRKDGELELETKRRIKNDILTQVDSLNAGVFVLGATSVPWLLDKTIKQCFQRGVYLTQPDAAARTKMFEAAVRDVSNTLTSENMRTLGQKSEGLTASDIDTLAQDALLQPVRKLAEAEYFKIITVDGRDKWLPCSPGDADAVSKSAAELAPDDILPLPVRYVDFEIALGRTRPSLSQQEIKRYEDWEIADLQSVSPMA